MDHLFMSKTLLQVRSRPLISGVCHCFICQFVKSSHDKALAGCEKVCSHIPILCELDGNPLLHALCTHVS